MTDQPMISDEIRAKVDEADRRLDAATPGEYVNEPDTGAGRVWVQVRIPWSWRKALRDRMNSRDVFDLEPLFNVRTSDEYAQRAADADLIVSVVNRERAQIEHARDVLERHTADVVQVWCIEHLCTIDDHDHDEPIGTRQDECNGCGLDNCENALPWPCPEILSLGRAWGVSDE